MHYLKSHRIKRLSNFDRNNYRFNLIFERYVCFSNDTEKIFNFDMNYLSNSIINNVYRTLFENFDHRFLKNFIALTFLFIILTSICVKFDILSKIF